MLILVVFFFLSTFLCLSATNFTDTTEYWDCFSIWQQSYVGPEHSNIYTDTEIIPEDIELNFGWIEGIGIWSIEGFNWFGPGVIPAIGNGYYDEDGIYVPTTIEPSSPGDNYTYYQITLPPDPANIPPGTTFPSIGFYVPDDL